MPIMKPWKNFLTRRSMLAVIVVAVTVTLSYWVLVTEIREEHDDFRIVSITKQQAAEIVTTLYLADLTAYAPDSARRNTYRRQLVKAVHRMEDRHRVLSLEDASIPIPEEMEVVLRDVYLGDQHVDEEMESFLRGARELLKSGGNVSELNDLARRRTTLVPAHMRLHERLRARTEAAFKRLRLLAAVQWLVVLAALGMVVMVIVRPTTRRAEKVMEEMWRARAAARERVIIADAARAAQANFIRTMSHELRTPLNAILGMAQLLRMQNLPPRQDGYVCDIQQAGGHLLGLINNVLDLGRIEANQVAITMKPTALNEILEKAAGMLRPLVAQKRMPVDLRVRCADELSGQYLADGAHIQQVLVNLIGNAVKFTEEGWIEVRAVPAGPEEAGVTPVRFEVEDTGIGVRGEVRDAIFEEFRQANHMVGGTGLGLAISRALVHLMGGQMGLESERKKGSLFWFVLPLERAGAGANA